MRMSLIPKQLPAPLFLKLKKGTEISTTTQLQEIIKDTLKFIPENKRKDEVKKSCMRCFQALRIDVNNEFEVLYEFLEKTS